jgi:hypothetical protein
MGQTRRSHDTRRPTAPLREGDEAIYLVPLRSGAVSASDIGIERDHASARLHSRQEGSSRARRVGHLLVGIIGLQKSAVGKSLEGEQVLFARGAAGLAFEDPRCGNRRHVEAVTDEEHQVLGSPADRSPRARCVEGALSFDEPWILRLQERRPGFHCPIRTPGQENRQNHPGATKSPTPAPSGSGRPTAGDALQPGEPYLILPHGFLPAMSKPA